MPASGNEQFRYRVGLPVADAALRARDMIIETSRLRLRPWRGTDAESFASMHADPEVMVDAAGPLNREKSDRKMGRYLAAFETHGFCRWAVESLDGTFVGYTGVMPRELQPLGKHFEVGWRLVRAAWGHGYATEAARASLEDVFHRIGLSEVLSYTSPDNIRSQRVMARLSLNRDASRDFTADDGWTGLVWVASAP